MRTQTMEPFAALAERVKQNSLQKQQTQRVAELARMIDELSGEMGSGSFRDAIRKHGYDVDADLGMLLRRGVDKIN